MNLAGVFRSNRQKIYQKRVKLLFFIICFLLGFDLILAVKQILPGFSFRIAWPGKIGSETRLVTLKTQPINLKGKGEMFLANQLFWIPENGYITKFKPKVIGADADLVFHHAIIASVGGHDSVCPEFIKIIYASGSELIEFDAPQGYGYKVQGVNRLLYIEAHFKNVGVSEFKNVSFEYEIEYKTKPQKPIEMVRLDVVCNHLPQFTVGPKSEQLRDSKLIYTASENGRILLTGGHLHHFGDYVALILNGVEMIRIPLLHGKDGRHIIETQTKRVDFKKGDQIGLRYRYFNPLDRAVDGMAIIFFAYERVDH